MLLMGIDAGTTGCKVIVFDETGRQVTGAYREYDLVCPESGWMELVPGDVLDAVFSCIKECTLKCGGQRINAAAVSTQGEALIPVDRDGEPLYNAIVTFDSRNIQEYRWFSEKFNKDYIMKKTGTPIHTMFSITKLLWIKGNLPDVYRKTWKFLSFGEFISFRMGSDPMMDYTMASRTMAFDISKNTWCDDILNTCGIEKEKLPDAIPAGTVIGRVNSRIAAILDLPADMAIVSGAHDQVCCSVGSGLINDKMAMDSLGTTESMLCVNSEAHITPGMADRNITCGAYAIKGLYAYHTFLSCSGSLLKWLRDKILQCRDNDIYKRMDCEVLKKYPKPSEVLILPYFAGSGTPYLDFESKGVIAGLTLDTDIYQIYKAIIEGVSMESRINIEGMEKCGIGIEEIRCIGGGANSRLWLQIKADITGKRIISMKVNEAGCLGAAMLAGVGCGMYGNVQEASEACVRTGMVFDPMDSAHDVYEEMYSRYKGLYTAFKAVNKS